jgi:2-iminobutanoate/2-iminopropanoate deaminase
MMQIPLVLAVPYQLRRRAMSRVQRKNIFPEKLSRRVVGGHLLYTPVVTVQGGTTIYVSGLLARDGAGNIVGKGDMAAQIQQVGENLRVSLEAAGATLKDLVRTCTYVTDIDAFFKEVETRQKYFGQALPTSTTIGVSRLSHPDFMVEVEAFAVIDDER